MFFFLGDIDVNIRHLSYRRETPLTQCKADASLSEQKLKAEAVSAVIKPTLSACLRRAIIVAGSGCAKRVQHKNEIESW